MSFHPFLPALAGLCGLLIGRLLFERWFNHFSLYSLIWGAGLALFEWRLIDYTPIAAEVWMLIGYAWAAFGVGAAILILAKAAIGERPSVEVVAYSTRTTLVEKRLLTAFILLLSLIAIVTVIQHWMVLINRFGSILGVLINGSRIYHLTVAGKITGKLPYFDSLALTGICLAGVYCARYGKITILALPPFAATILSDIGQGGRAKILIGGILFFTAYLLTRLSPAPSRAMHKAKKLIAFIVVFASLLSAMEFIRSYRGAFESFYGASKELSRFEGKIFFTPSIYIYLSSHPGVLSAYWKAGGEPTPFPGSYTFAPLFRVLAKFGLTENVPFFQKFYNIPFATNTATYLRELHSDFGITGILVAPFLLGLVTTHLWLKVRQRYSLVTISLLTHVYVIIAFTYLFQVTRLGQLAVSLIAALFIGGIVDHIRDQVAAERKPAA